MVPDKKICSYFPNISLCETYDTGVGPFLARGAQLIKLGRGPLDDATFDTKYQVSRPCGFRQEDFFMFSLYANVKHVTPGAGPFLVLGE